MSDRIKPKPTEKPPIVRKDIGRPQGDAIRQREVKKGEQKVHRNDAFRLRDETRNQGDTQKLNNPQERRSEKEHEVSMERLSPELRESVRSARAAQKEIGVFPPDKAAATVEGGPRTLSGWEHKQDGFVQATDRVMERSKEIGHGLACSGYLDKGVPGRYNASHAEKQISIIAPDKPIAVSRPMCDDCPKYFTSLARFTDKPQVVSDTEYVRIFYPNGKIEKIRE